MESQYSFIPVNNTFNNNTITPNSSVKNTTDVSEYRFIDENNMNRFPKYSYSVPNVNIKSEVPIRRKQINIRLPSLKDLNLIPITYKEAEVGANNHLTSPIQTQSEPNLHESNPKFIIIHENQHDSPLPNQRWKVTKEQAKLLNSILKKNYYPNTQLRNKLAKELALSPRTVQIWFQNKRQAYKYKFGTNPPHSNQLNHI